MENTYFCIVKTINNNQTIIKLSLVITVLFLCSTHFVSSYAQGTNPEPVKLSLVKVGDDGGIGERLYPRSPVLIPSVSIEGHTLILYSGCDGCTIELRDEDGQTVYSVYVEPGTESIGPAEELAGCFVRPDGGCIHGIPGLRPAVRPWHGYRQHGMPVCQPWVAGNDFPCKNKDQKIINLG